MMYNHGTSFSNRLKRRMSKVVGGVRPHKDEIGERYGVKVT